MVDDGQAPDLDVGHVARNFLDILVVKTILDVLCHDLAHLGSRTLAPPG